MRREGLFSMLRDVTSAISQDPWLAAPAAIVVVMALALAVAGALWG